MQGLEGEKQAHSSRSVAGHVSSGPGRAGGARSHVTSPRAKFMVCDHWLSAQPGLPREARRGAPKSQPQIPGDRTPIWCDLLAQEPPTVPQGRSQGEASPRPHPTEQGPWQPSARIQTSGSEIPPFEEADSPAESPSQQPLKVSSLLNWKV